MSDFQTTTRPKSRKVRQCPECRATIQPGERYALMAGTCDGDFYTAIQCEPCHVFGERFAASLSLASWLRSDEATYPYGDMLAQASDHLGYAWSAPPTAGGLPAKRDAMMARFDEFDESERAYQAVEREKKKADARRQATARASRRMIAGMSRFSRSPPTPEPQP